MEPEAEAEEETKPSQKRKREDSPGPELTTALLERAGTTDSILLAGGNVLSTLTTIGSNRRTCAWGANIGDAEAAEIMTDAFLCIALANR